MPYILDKKYNSLDRLEKWDEVTQGVIKKRLNQEIGDSLLFNFLTEKEGEILEIITDVLIPQEKNEGYIKIAKIIDRGLSDKKEGVRYGDNPWLGEFYKKGLKMTDARARELYDRPVENLNYQELNDFVSGIMKKEAGFLHKFIRKVLSDSINIFFSHPKSWNKIGFPGPAYPEGYSNLDCGEKDSWEPEYIQKS